MFNIKIAYSKLQEQLKLSNAKQVLHKTDCYNSTELRVYINCSCSYVYSFSFRWSCISFYMTVCCMARTMFSNVSAWSVFDHSVMSLNCSSLRLCLEENVHRFYLMMFQTLFQKSAHFLLIFIAYKYVTVCVPGQHIIFLELIGSVHMPM